jgi:hypothetical protein
MVDPFGKEAICPIIVTMMEAANDLAIELL